MSTKTYNINLLKTNITFEADDNQIGKISEALHPKIATILSTHRVVAKISSDDNQEKIIYPDFIDDDSLEFVSLDLFQKSYKFQATKKQLGNIAQQLNLIIIKDLLTYKICPEISTIDYDNEINSEDSTVTKNYEALKRNLVPMPKSVDYSKKRA